MTNNRYNSYLTEFQKVTKQVPDAYVFGFFVWLLFPKGERDGSIQVNHWKGISLQYRIIIKLKDAPGNKKMLEFIRKKLGLGFVRETTDKSSGNKFVIWVEKNPQRIREFLPFFNDYWLLTSRR